MWKWIGTKLLGNNNQISKLIWIEKFLKCGTLSMSVFWIYSLVERTVNSWRPKSRVHVGYTYRTQYATIWTLHQNMWWSIVAIFVEIQFSFFIDWWVRVQFEYQKEVLFFKNTVWGYLLCFLRNIWEFWIDKVCFYLMHADIVVI